MSLAFTSIKSLISRGLIMWLSKALAAGDSVLRLGLYLLLFTGQREGDVIRMKWGDIRE